jgi:hypothetical protein
MGKTSRLYIFLFLITSSLPAHCQQDSLSLSTLISQISLQHNVRIFVHPQWITGKKSVKYPVGAALEVALDSVLQGTGLTRVAYEPNLLVLLPSKESVQIAREFQGRMGSGQTMEWVGDSTLPYTSDKVLITGRVIDDAGSPLPFASVTIDGPQTGVVTNEQGKFSLRMTPGLHEIQVSALSHNPFEKTYKVWSAGEIEIRLTAAYFELNEVLLESTSADRNVRSTQLGYVSFDATALRSLPAVLGQPDVIRAISFLPGVSSAGEGATGFNVRGGSIDQTLVTQDGTLIYNTSHVGGVFSVFNPDVIQSAEINKGSMSARLGGRLGSALEVTTRNGDLSRWKVRGGIGPLTAQAMVEGPVLPGKISVLAAWRGGTADHILRQLQNLDLRDGSARFYDGNLKILFRINPKIEWVTGGFATSDYLRFSDAFGFSWKNSGLFTNLRVITSNTSVLLIHASESRYESTGFDPSGFDAFTLSNGLRSIKIKPVWKFQPFTGHTISLGGEMIHYDALPETRAPFHAESRIDPAHVSHDEGRETGLFISDEFSVGLKMNISVGLRWTHYQQTGVDTLFSFNPGLPLTEVNILDANAITGNNLPSFSGWEPRIAMSFRLNESQSIKAGYNRTRQALHLITQTQAATPVDLWQPSTHYLPPQTGNQFSLGFFKNFFSHALESSIEGFFRTMDGLPEPKDLSKVLLNNRIETALVSANGIAYGGEIMIKKNHGDLTGWFSYGFSRSLRRIQNSFPDEVISEGEWFPSAFDRPHQINTVCNWKLNRRLSLAGTFTWQSGRPVSAPETAYFVQDARFLDYRLRNNYRIPAYTRTDFSLTFEPNSFQKKRFKSVYNFSIYNLLSRRNAFSLFYVVETNQRPRAYSLSVLGAGLPSVSWNFSF